MGRGRGQTAPIAPMAPTHCTVCPTSLPHRRSLKFLAASSTRPHSVNGARGVSGVGVSAPHAEGWGGMGVNEGGGTAAPDLLWGVGDP